MKSTLTPLTIAALVGYGLCYDFWMTLAIIYGAASLYWVVLWVLNFKKG